MVAGAQKVDEKSYTYRDKNKVKNQVEIVGDNQVDECCNRRNDDEAEVEPDEEQFFVMKLFEPWLHAEL